MVPAPLIALAFLMCLTTVLVAWVIVRDSPRYLARFYPLHEPAVSGTYLSGLSNFLEQLHERHVASAWPKRYDALAAALFQLRVRPVWRRSRRPSAQLLQEHLTLWAQLEILQPYIQQAVLAERQRLAVAAILELPDTPEREQLMQFVNHVRVYRDSFLQALSAGQCRVYHQLDRTHFLQTLRKVHAVFDEHGYALLPELDELQAWESLPAAELPRYVSAVRLPTLVALPSPGLMALGVRTARG